MPIWTTRDSAYGLTSRAGYYFAQPSKGSFPTRAASEMGIKASPLNCDPNLFQRSIIKDAVHGITNIWYDLDVLAGEPTCPTHETILCSGSCGNTPTRAVCFRCSQWLNSEWAVGRKSPKWATFWQTCERIFCQRQWNRNRKSVHPINQTGSRILHLGLNPQIIPCEL